MIERLTGKVVWCEGTGVVLDVCGVGYGVELTAGALKLVENSSGDIIELWIHTHVREDQFKLYGFGSREEKVAFALCLSVAGVGPKLAMAIMSTLELGDLVDAVSHDDAKVLEAVPGIGPRQSKKILLELKPKLDKLALAHLMPVAAKTARGLELDRRGAVAGWSEALTADLTSALMNLGYKEKEIVPELAKVKKMATSTEFSELFKLALAELSGRARAGGVNQPGDSLNEVF